MGEKKIEMVHILETDAGLIDLGYELRNVRPEVREAIIAAIPKFTPSGDGTCPGCGKTDC